MWFFRICLLAVFLVSCTRQEMVQGAEIIYSLPEAQSQPIIVNIDSTFTQDQQKQILKALNAWERASNWRLSFIYYFNQPRPGYFKSFYKLKYLDNSMFIWKIEKEERENNLNEEISENTKTYIGFWDGASNIVIFMDKFNNENFKFYNIILHEFGHMIGLSHNKEKKNVMEPNAFYISNCITNLDAEKLCKIYDCKPKPECI